MQEICNDPKMVQTLRLLSQIWSSDIREHFYFCVMHPYPTFWVGCAQFLQFSHWIEYGCSFRQGLIHYIKYKQNVYMHSNRD